MPPHSYRGGREAANQYSCFLPHNHHHMQDLRNQPAASASRDPPWGRKALFPSGISKELSVRMFSQQSSSCTHLKCTVVQPCPLESCRQQSRCPWPCAHQGPWLQQPWRFSQARFSILRCALAGSAVWQVLSISVVCSLICPARLSGQIHDLHNTAQSHESYPAFTHD